MEGGCGVNVVRGHYMYGKMNATMNTIMFTEVTIIFMGYANQDISFY